jgi:hypothetical protein
MAYALLEPPHNETFLTVLMPLKLPRFNRREEVWTWHFTSALAPTHEINAWYQFDCHNHTNVVLPQRLLVNTNTGCILEKVLIDASFSLLTRGCYVLDIKFKGQTPVAKLPSLASVCISFAFFQHVSIPGTELPVCDIYNYWSSGYASLKLSTRTAAVPLPCLICRGLFSLTMSPCSALHIWRKNGIQGG